MRLIDAGALRREFRKGGIGNLGLDGAQIAHVRRMIDNAPTVERPHGTCKTCKHYNPYRDQFSYGYRGDGYCKSTITTSEGQAYINCHDEWYCANYEKAGEKE